ncbi:MAG: MFS transporter [Pseudomonadota bacterium]
MTLPKIRPGYAWYVVILLALLSIVSYADRLILAILVDPVKQELAVSDTQMGLLLGLSFASVYATLALILAQVADRHNRRNLIIIGVLIWSVMTSCSAFADNFWQLALCRLGVGVGEAALGPAALSMIADLFNREKRHTPVSVFLAAGTVGGATAYLIGGAAVAAVSQMSGMDIPLIGEMSPWRLVFLGMGVPGILLGILMLFSVKEPVRISGDDMVSEVEASVIDVVAHLRSARGLYAPIFLGLLFVQMMVYAIATWFASVFIRQYGLSITDTGYAFGFVALIFGTSGAIFGPYLVSRLERANISHAIFRIAALAVAISVPGAIFAPIAPSLSLSIGALCVAMFGLSAGSALPALLPQLIAPNAVRARVTALYFFIANIVGLGLTPVLIGLLNDLRPFGLEGVHQSLTFLAAIILPLSLSVICFGWCRQARHF